MVYDFWYLLAAVPVAITTVCVIIWNILHTDSKENAITSEMLREELGEFDDDKYDVW